jgi:hypothetical protein
MFQTKIVGKIKPHSLCLMTFFQKSYRLRGNVEKYGSTRQATDGNKTQRRKDAIYMPDN